MAIYIPTKTIKLKPRPGMPAGSVRLKYSMGQKAKLLTLLEQHIEVYCSAEDWFYQEYEKPIGKDTRRKSTETIFREIAEKLPVWQKIANDIQESYILRNNYVVEQAAVKQHLRGVDTKLIDQYINCFYIEYNDVQPKLYTIKPKIDIFA